MDLTNGNSIIVKDVCDVNEAFEVLTVFKDYEFLEKVKEDSDREAYAKKWAEKSDFLVAYSGEEAIGCFIMYTDNTVDDCAFITYIVTKNDVGILSSFALLSLWINAISVLRKKSLTKFRLETDKNNKKAQSPSKAIGFKCVGDASENTIFMEAEVDEVERKINKLQTMLNRQK